MSRKPHINRFSKEKIDHYKAEDVERWIKISPLKEAMEPYLVHLAHYLSVKRGLPMTPKTKSLKQNKFSMMSEYFYSPEWFTSILDPSAKCNLPLMIITYLRNTLSLLFMKMTVSNNENSKTPTKKLDKISALNLRNLSCYPDDNNTENFKALSKIMEFPSNEKDLELAFEQESIIILRDMDHSPEAYARRQLYIELQNQHVKDNKLVQKLHLGDFIQAMTASGHLLYLWPDNKQWNNIVLPDSTEIQNTLDLEELLLTWSQGDPPQAHKSSSSLGLMDEMKKRYPGLAEKKNVFRVVNNSTDFWKYLVRGFLLRHPTYSVVDVWEKLLQCNNFCYFENCFYLPSLSLQQLFCMVMEVCVILKVNHGLEFRVPDMIKQNFNQKIEEMEKKKRKNKSYGSSSSSSSSTATNPAPNPSFNGTNSQSETGKGVDHHQEMPSTPPPPPAAAPVPVPASDVQEVIPPPPEPKSSKGARGKRKRLTKEPSVSSANEEEEEAKTNPSPRKRTRSNTVVTPPPPQPQTADDSDNEPMTMEETTVSSHGKGMISSSLTAIESSNHQNYESFDFLKKWLNDNLSSIIKSLDLYQLNYTLLDQYKSDSQQPSTPLGPAIKSLLESNPDLLKLELSKKSRLLEAEDHGYMRKVFNDSIVSYMEQKYPGVPLSDISSLKLPLTDLLVNWSLLVDVPKQKGEAPKGERKTQLGVLGAFIVNTQIENMITQHPRALDPPAEARMRESLQKEITQESFLELELSLEELRSNDTYVAMLYGSVLMMERLIPFVADVFNQILKTTLGEFQGKLTEQMCRDIDDHLRDYLWAAKVEALNNNLTDLGSPLRKMKDLQRVSSSFMDVTSEEIFEEEMALKNSTLPALTQTTLQQSREFELHLSKLVSTIRSSKKKHTIAFKKMLQENHKNLYHKVHVYRSVDERTPRDEVIEFSYDEYLKILHMYTENCV